MMLGMVFRRWEYFLDCHRFSIEARCDPLAGRDTYAVGSRSNFVRTSNAYCMWLGIRLASSCMNVLMTLECLLLYRPSRDDPGPKNLTLK